MSTEITVLVTKASELKDRMESTPNQQEAACACRRMADLQIIIDALSDLETRIVALEP